MVALIDKSSNLYIPSLVVIRILKDLVKRVIPKYNGVSDLVQPFVGHEAFLLGRTYNDDHIELLFPSTLSGTPPHVSLGYVRGIYFNSLEVDILSYSYILVPIFKNLLLSPYYSLYKEYHPL